jgi:hypothetical protein
VLRLTRIADGQRHFPFGQGLNWASWTAGAAPAAGRAVEVRATSSNELAVTSVQHTAVEKTTAASLNMVSPPVRGTLEAFLSTERSPDCKDLLAGRAPTHQRYPTIGRSRV